jgi:hypothetical protein
MQAAAESAAAAAAAAPEVTVAVEAAARGCPRYILTRRFEIVL